MKAAIKDTYSVVVGLILVLAVLYILARIFGIL